MKNKPEKPSKAIKYKESSAMLNPPKSFKPKKSKKR